ncbi:hypothetical protein [Mucilaginibacter sp. L3T2-6]|uniref:hypothetical protein n=1 Tax=Mucilaginibacter sp. L3T2-6 TaxID=3062491 RepID=UPI002676238B|nr:hypothetical protein [Mucilaginibacter sp. L3T2-6]MDO3644301.1 hypothetical protein [Mucilaginibacter sp. L3T2-6]MDV6216752.1 hypothetical protein [Mucilaginibacter sp. L3T2-6]
MKNRLSKSDKEAEQPIKDMERQIIEEVQILNKFDCNAELIEEFEVASSTDLNKSSEQ